MKGIFHERPPQPRYTETWDVSKVTTYLVSLRQNDSLTLSVLTHKTVMLLALTTPCRSADLCQLDLQFGRYLPEGASFQPIKLSKQSHQAKPLVDFFFQLSLPMNYFAQWQHSGHMTKGHGSSECYRVMQSIKRAKSRACGTHNLRSN